MSSSTFHRCQNCGAETYLTHVLGVFEENPSCRQCGLSMLETDTKMQDELSSMLAHSLSLNTIPSQPANASMPTTPQVLPQTNTITYISQHYHHSAHQVPQAEVSASTILSNAGVDASVLFPSQLTLFKNAPPDQQMRLIELWRIAPPTYGNQMLARDLGNWPQTSMQQEEEAARDRWQRSEQEKYKNLSAPSEQRPNAEPYIVSGYELSGASPTSDGSMKEYRQATDPAYQSREWWKMSDSEPTEHQYGLLQHMRMYGQQLDQSGENHEDEEML